MQGRAKGDDKQGAQLIGQFGVGFYSAFMVADTVDVVTRAAGSAEAWLWSSDGKGEFTVAPASPDEAPVHGTRVVLHLMDDAKSYAERYTIERLVKAQSGHVPVPIAIVDKPGEEPTQIADGAALWTKPKADISLEDYTEFYRSVAGQYDEPAATIHFRAEGRHEYTALAFVPGSKPFDLFDPDRKGRMKLYVKRVFITDEAELLPRYLRFVRGIVDSGNLPLNVSREMIQDSPILSAIRKGVTSRVLSDLAKLAENDKGTFETIWGNFGTVLKEGLYEDYERREQLLELARFKTTEAPSAWRSLKDYVAALKENQTAIYYITGDDLTRLETSPQIEGFRARDLEVLLLSDPVDSFWVSNAPDFEGKPFRSVTQGAADLNLIPLVEGGDAAIGETSPFVTEFVAFMKLTLGDAVADVRISDRLTESAVCLVASEQGPDRHFEKLLAQAGQTGTAAKPILEVNPRHTLMEFLAGSTDMVLREDAAHLLFDEARILDGERVADPKAFSSRLARIMLRGVPS